MDILHINHTAVTGYRVNSSNLDMVGYSEADARMYVRYKSGEVYFYANIAEPTFDFIVTAKERGESCGKTFNTLVRKNPPGDWEQLTDYMFSHIAPASKYRTHKAQSGKRFKTVGDLIAEWAADTADGQSGPTAHSAWSW